MPKSPSRKSAALESTIAGASHSSGVNQFPAKKGTAAAGRIMYIECKAGGLTGPNYYDLDTGEDYWISGPKRYGGDALYGSSTPIEIDEDVREEYWREIRRQPLRINDRVA
jgi:hypothetical protein